MRGGLPPSHALSGSLASREAANHVAASTYRPGGEFGELGDAGEGSASQLQRDAYGRPSTLAQDLAAMGGDLGSGLSNDRERHNERRTQDPLGRSSKRLGTSPTDHQPFFSSSSHSPELSLPMPSSFNRASGLPSLNSGVNDPFKLPLPKASSRSRGSTAEQNGLGNPFDPNRILAPPRSSEIGTTSSSRGVGRLPSLSQALEMHPELSPDPTSFRYPADFEQSLFSGSDDRKGAAGGSAASGSPRLRRRSSLSRMNDLTALSRSPLAGPNIGGGLLSGTSSLASVGPLQSGSGDSIFRAPAPRTTPRSGEFAAPLTPSFSRSLRRMPSDISMTVTARRQSLRDSEMGRDNFPPSSQYGL